MLTDIYETMQRAAINKLAIHISLNKHDDTQTAIVVYPKDRPLSPMRHTIYVDCASDDRFADLLRDAVAVVIGRQVKEDPPTCDRGSETNVTQFPGGTKSE